MDKKRWEFLKYVPIAFAIIVSIAIIWWESSQNNGQGGCLSMIVLVIWTLAGLMTSGD